MESEGLSAALSENVSPDKLTILRKILLYLGGFLGLVYTVRFMRVYIEKPPFIDEENFIAAAKNFFVHGNYTVPGWADFDWIVSAGLWSVFPSGIAAAWGANLSQIRVVFLCFSLFMVCVGIYSIFRRYEFFERNDRLPWSVVFTFLLLRFLVYPDGFFMTLGEIPSFGFLLLGIGLGGVKKGEFSAIGFIFLGLSVFGGKVTNSVMVGPLFLCIGMNNHFDLKQWLKGALWLISPFIFWVGIVGAFEGIPFAVHWLVTPYGILQNYALTALGRSTDASIHIPFSERFTSPKLEWAGYALLQKIKIVVFLFVPGLIVLLRRNRLSSGIGIGVGLWLIGIWYFCIHPTMWIRHIQVEVAMGMALIGYFCFSGILKSKCRTSYEVAFLLVALVTFLK